MTTKHKRPARKKWLLFALLTAIVLFAAGGVFIYKFYDIYFRSSTDFEEKERLLCIPPNSSFDQVATLLERENMISDVHLLRAFAKLKGYDTKTYSGRYTISRGMSLRSLMVRLVSRQQTPVQLVVPSVRTPQELAGRIAKQLALDSAELIGYLSDARTAQQYNFTLEEFPAMFVPNTYEVYRDTTPEKLLARLNKEYAHFWNAKRSAQAEKVGLSKIEVATLASIIQEEVLHETELPKIARVYLNRLHIGMPLQACPTAKFAAGDMTISRVLQVHTQIESPYNTYKHKGLPPGPIRYPSIVALNAVLEPDDNDYLFFCAKADFSGYHNFSRTGAQHAQYAREYQRELNRRGIK